MAALTWSTAAHLLRCTGFGTTGTAVDAVVGKDPATVVAAIVGVDSDADPGVKATPVPDLDAIPDHDSNANGKQKAARHDVLKRQRDTISNWWTSRILAVEEPFAERMTFAWHGIYATSMSKVRQAPMMLKQNTTLRDMGRGNFLTFATAMMKDPALMFWLDAPRNHKASPNENLARESLELFMLGHGDGYTEDDVHNVARALTGWRIDKAGVSSKLATGDFDDSAKTILGVTKNFDVDSYVAMVVARPQSAAFVLGRLWAQLVSDQPMDATTQKAVVAAYGSGHDLSKALTAMLTSPGFTAATASRVVSPVEWTYGLARAVGAAHDNDDTVSLLNTTLVQLGQQPYYPPSVGGWPAGPAWLSTTAAMARGRAAEQIVARGDVSAVEQAGSADRVDAAAHLLGIDSWSTRSRTALAPLAADPPTLVAMAANTPEYLTV